MSGSKSSDVYGPHGSSPLPEAIDHPLDLTVHSLPAPGAAVQAAQRMHGRWKMLAVMLVCAAPVVASYFTYYVVRPEGRRNFGELITPQRPLPALAARDPAGRTVDLRTLEGQWLLVAVGPGACSDDCQHNLYLQRQLRESMGRDRDRMDRVWLVTDDAALPEAIGPGLRGATVLRVDAGRLAQWLAPAAGAALADHLYVVDPLGHWMLRFPAHLDAAGALRAKRDLERLLRASASWDEAGRPSEGGVR